MTFTDIYMIRHREPIQDFDLIVLFLFVLRTAKNSRNDSDRFSIYLSTCRISIPSF